MGLLKVNLDDAYKVHSTVSVTYLTLSRCLLILLCYYLLSFTEPRFCQGLCPKQNCLTFECRWWTIISAPERFLVVTLVHKSHQELSGQELKFGSAHRATSLMINQGGHVVGGFSLQVNKKTLHGL